MAYERYQTGLNELCESVLAELESILDHSNDDYRDIGEWLDDQNRYEVGTTDLGAYGSALITIMNNPEVQIGTKDKFVRGFWGQKVIELPVPERVIKALDEAVRRRWKR